MAGNVPFVTITYKENTTATNAGTYEVTCICDDNCFFFDTGTNVCNTIWKINKCPVNVPSGNKKYPYTGEIVTPNFDYSPDVLDISGNINGIEIGDYIALFDIRDKDNYEWVSGVPLSPINGGKAAIGWEIVYSAVTVKVPYQSNYLVYNGNNQSPVFANCNQNYMTLIGGIPSEKNAGKYKVIVKLKDNCIWSDGSITDKIVEWEIHKKEIPTPYIKTSTATDGMYYYEIEGKRYPVWQNYDPSLMIYGGDTYDIDSSWHITNFDLKDTDNYVWQKIDNSYTYTVRWKLSVTYEPEIVPGSDDTKVHIPKQIKTPYEDGTTKYPQWDRFDDNAIIKIGGVWEGINGGIYYVILELRDGYIWEDNTYEIKTVPWKILGIGEEQDPYDLISIHIPIQINIPYYDGLVKEPEWDEWDKFGIDIVEGDLYGMPAGTYYLIIRPQTGYMWEDGTIEDKTITWIINPRDIEEIPDDPVPKDPSPERDESESGNGNCCCCAPCCDMGAFSIFNCPEDDSGCDCS